MTATTTSDPLNPLNIREGDVTEFTGDKWPLNQKGNKQTVTSVSGCAVYYSSGHHLLSPPEGYEHTVHYVARDGDRYLHPANGRVYTIVNGTPVWGKGSETFFACPLTSENYTRLALEPAKPKLSVKIAPVGADLNDEGSWADITEAIVGGDFSSTPEIEEPKTSLQWITVDGNKVKDGDKVRIPGNLGADFTVENGQISIAPNVSIPTYSFEELEVLRAVIELPTSPGHYESLGQGMTFDLDGEGNWTQMVGGGNREGASRGELEDAAPLTRFLAQDEANEQKQAALGQQKAQNEAKRKQARKRHDDYQEELLAIIRRRNEENLRLVEQVDELQRELYALRSA